MGGVASTIAALAIANLVLLTAVGCPYRVQGPPAMAETVQVVVVSNASRLPRAQAYLQDEVALALTKRLGWKVGPTGTARLELVLNQERKRQVGTGDRNIPNRWSIVLDGSALIASRQGNRTYAYTGTGYESSRADEPDGLRAAAAACANDLAGWLEAEFKQPIAASVKPATGSTKATSESVPPATQTVKPGELPAPAAARP